VAKWVGVSVPAVIDHACAKEKRFLGWSEKVSYVRWMKFEMKWIPGSANDFADLLSRMADRLHQCIEERGASLQMYHMHVAVVHHVSGYESYDLGLDSDQWAEVKRAYLVDDGTVQSVKLSDVYRCVCMDGEGVSSEVKMKVAPWVDRRFFSVEPPGSGGVRVVYTPRAQLREQWEKRDQSRVLVLMVPAGAMVRITTGKPVTGTVAEVPEYEVIDLRRDLLLMCHDNAGHPSPGATITAVKLLAYWPTLAVKDGRDSAQKHWLLCAHCSAEADLAGEHGLGVESLCRMEVVQIDHLILSNEHAELAGCIGTLSIVDVATRFRVFDAVQSQSAEDTARSLLDSWVPYFGVPLVLVSDPHSGFASDVMAYIRKVVGVKEHDVSAARAKGKVAIVERSHRGLREILADGFSKGDITSLKNFKLYLTMAMVRANQTAQAGRVSPVELWCGQRVRSMQSIAMTGGEVEVRNLGDDGEVEFVSVLKRLVDELGEYERHMRDDVSRKNALRRDKDDQVTGGSHAVKMKMKIGDQVSFEGRTCEVLELHGEVGHPVTATIRDRGAERRVKYAEMRIRAAAVPVKMMPIDVSEGSFVLWKDSDGCLSGGTVEEVLPGGQMQVLAREQDAGAGKNWLPTWVGLDGEVIRAKKKPKGMAGNLVVVDLEEIEMAGVLTQTHRMTDATVRAAVAAGLM
jgi:hypothetical protein